MSVLSVPRLSGGGRVDVQGRKRLGEKGLGTG